MTDTILKFNRLPEPRTLLPVIPTLSCMVLTLQVNHKAELSVLERIYLFMASMHLMMDGDDRAHVKHLERAHKIWLRVMGGAA